MQRLCSTTSRKMHRATSLAPISIQSSTVVTLKSAVYEDFAPWSFELAGKPAGIDVDIANLIAEDLKNIWLRQAKIWMQICEIGFGKVQS